MASSVTFPLTKRIALEGEACANWTKNVLFRLSNRKFQTQSTGKLYYFFLCPFLEASAHTITFTYLLHTKNIITFIKVQVLFIFSSFHCYIIPDI
ncbi:unnamed protein product [Acanthoscelides obtectus]|uniref:Uncharacterized protein n=1 Tax=Acanthoscelides obtectus TaxID=200917 RepID=A0A9P0NVW9_ACAOB|nr:unnamed protein product [Acanthoscelides obtectus]CAK1671277.1 hypothetical protein AOBTE_LOCUS28206 [Acanthoscelides obtectus]